jgi:hypothetical protein
LLRAVERRANSLRGDLWKLYPDLLPLLISQSDAEAANDAFVHVLTRAQGKQGS